MRIGNALFTHLALRLGVVAVFLLAIAILGGSAPAPDVAKPPQTKEQTPKKGEKQDEAKAAPVKLGLSLNDPKALQGYTLMSPFSSPNTYLLDMQGRVVHTWKTECSPALSAVLL